MADEHDKRAREVAAQLLYKASSTEVAFIASALRSTAAAAVAAKDAEWRERVSLRANHMAAPNGPECWCGAPSSYQSGECQRCGSAQLREYEHRKEAVAAERERALRIIERAAETQGDLASNYARNGDDREYRHAHAFDVLEALRVAIGGTPVAAAPLAAAASPAQAERVSEEERERAAETVRMLRCIARMYVPDSPGGMALDHAISVLRSEADALEGT